MHNLFQSTKCYLNARFFLLIGSVRSLSGVLGITLGGMIETLEGVGEGGESEGEDERKSSTSPLVNGRREEEKRFLNTWNSLACFCSGLVFGEVMGEGCLSLPEEALVPHLV